MTFSRVPAYQRITRLSILISITITLLEAAENLPEYSLSFLEILPEIITICIRNFMPELRDRMCERPFQNFLFLGF